MYVHTTDFTQVWGEVTLDYGVPHFIGKELPLRDFLSEYCLLGHVPDPKDVRLHITGNRMNVITRPQ